MDYKKARKQLKKIKTLLDSFESLGEPISEMEANLLKKYADQFKNIIPFGVEDEDSGPSVKIAEAPVLPINKATPAPKVVEKKEAVKVVKTKAVVADFPIEEEEDFVGPLEVVEDNIEEEFDVIPEPEPVPELKIKAKTKATVKKVQPKKKEPKTLVATVDEEELSNISLWEPVEITELSQKLSFSPIKNIFKSISINERIFTQNELFGGNHVLFRATLEKIELMSGFEEASEFLQTAVAKEHTWESPKKLKKASQFMSLVQRRFL